VSLVSLTFGRKRPYSLFRGSRASIVQSRNVRIVPISAFWTVRISSDFGVHSSAAITCEYSAESKQSTIKSFSIDRRDVGKH
jgi:hypothetical protein